MTPLQAIAVELVPTNTEAGATHAISEAQKYRALFKQYDISAALTHIMMPGIIEEDQGRPIDVRSKMDVLDFWSAIHPQLPGLKGLCTQVSAFSDESRLRTRITELTASGIEGIVFVGVPRTMSDGQGPGVSPVEALDIFHDVVDHRGVILIPTREQESARLAAKCAQGATFAMTQLLYSSQIVTFLTDFAHHYEYRPEIVLSFGFVPAMESHVGLIHWLIQDPHNRAVEQEQHFVSELARSDQSQRTILMMDLFRRVIDQVITLGFPLSLHLEATYGISPAAVRLFSQMITYWKNTVPTTIS